MTASLRSVVTLLVGAAILLGLAAAFWWLGSQTESSQSADLAPAAATAAEPLPTPTSISTTTPIPVPTATPMPTPTPTPTPLATSDLYASAAIELEMGPPIMACESWLGGLTPTNTGLPMRCADPAMTTAAAVADGRVVHVVRETVVPDLDTYSAEGRVTWNELGQMGAHVVVDHGGALGPSNTQTVYAGLASIDDSIRVGSLVTAGAPIGELPADTGELLFATWVEGRHTNGRTILAAAAPGAADQLAIANALGEQVMSPTDPQCAMVLASGQLPGAPRSYRNGTHQGIDFGCGAADRFTHALAAGTVVYLVDDYVDPVVPDREALLSSAARTRSTPVWTLAMLYGNVVIIDHGDLPGVGRVVTISAHLEAVDPAITLGSTVAAGQVVGEIGNRGTNAASLGKRGAEDPTLHLHWELFVDGWFLGQGLDVGSISNVVEASLCGAANTPGCP